MPDQIKNQLAGDRLLAALKEACDGLVFVSETDSEVVSFLVDKDDCSSMDEFIRKQTSKTNHKVERKPAADFFEKLTCVRDWHNERDRVKRKRFLKLRELIFGSLRDVEVTRIGRTRVQIFVAGYDRAGNIAGVKTSSVET